MKKKYDIVLYGATGFTGRQAAAYLGGNAPEGVTWAVAGRDRRRLQDVADSVDRHGSRPDVLAADAGDCRAIGALAGEARVVASTAGPFSLSGENLVAACAKQGTDYVDITGETAFVRRMIDAYGSAARASGAKIIPCCGFDAVPSDIGTYLAVRHVRKITGGGTRAIRGYFSIRGGLNGGTFSTMLNMFESGAWEEMKNPNLLTDGPEGAPGRPGMGYRARYDRRVRSWTAPFLMGVINTPVVNRSAALLSDCDQSYGRDFRYSEYHRIGGRWNPLPALAISSALRTVDKLGEYALVRRIMKRIGPGIGEGPSEHSMNRGYFRFDVVAEPERGPSVTVRLAGEGDPGNRATVKFLCESALCLALDREKLPGGRARGGFLTPAAGLGTILADRLRRTGVSIEVPAGDAGSEVAA